ncbi:MAG: DUF499 domain-containing protein [Firmicutes bacterium]|nr:DUF499 domain-containing protein [Bacillota bacterium]
MMPLQPWYKVVAPREDLREGRPLDASEFAVHLDRVRAKNAPEVYVDPARFFERTYPTKSLVAIAAEVLRRLSGDTVGASAVFNLTTQFGGGKTHALTLLYHLAQAGPESIHWTGVPNILERARLKAPPGARVAVFVGQGFDALRGRSGPAEPVRRTPWGEIAYQLGGERALAVLAEHDRHGVAPGSEEFLKAIAGERPALILMDEVMNYVARARAVPAGENRASNGATQFYHFLHNLTEAAQRPEGRIAVLCSLQASDMEMTAEDEADYARLGKLLDRVAKSVLLSEGPEIAEIVRRRLFEWGGLPAAGRETTAAYARWVREHRVQLPEWFSADAAEAAFAQSYPLHPMVLSVFERKWQALPHFQRTRGILRLLALWIAQAYQQGYRGTQRDALLMLGTAPLDDGMFRSAVFEQLGEQRLEGAVTADIAGERGAWATRLDEAAAEPLRRARLHRKVATTIFFESNGGQARSEASVGEIRLAVGEPDLDIGWVEQALDALRESCYYLHVDASGYRFGVRPNLNKLLADRKAAISPEAVDALVWERVQEVFSNRKGVRGQVRLVLGPERTGDIPDQPVLTLAVLRPERAMADEAAVRAFVDTALREHGASGRTFKNALVFAVAATPAELADQARKVLAWQGLQEDAARLGLDEEQRRQLAASLASAQRDLTEAVWRTYRHVLLMGKDGSVQAVDLGLVHSSAAESLVALIMGELERMAAVTPALGSGQLLRLWPPARTEWSTQDVRDAVFASPQFPRLLDGSAIRRTIADGVAQGRWAYGTVGGGEGGLRLGEAMDPSEVEISQDAFIVTAEEARRRKSPAPTAEGGRPPAAVDTGAAGPPPPGGREEPEDGAVGPSQPDRGAHDLGAAERPRVTSLRWAGELPNPQGNWSLFYRQVLMPLARLPRFHVRVEFEAENPAGLDDGVRADVRQALRELTGQDPVMTEAP